MTGKTLGHYRIDEKLGEGGMGVVYRAHDERLDREVALKILPASSFSDPTARARLLREARSAASLNHPHICTIYEVGEADGQAYIAMELVEGEALSARLAGGALPTEQVLRYGLQLAEALGHAHERGLVHRDLKSANVVITTEGRAKVLDFGLAKRLSENEMDVVTRSQASLTAPGALVGTLAYMAPEQLRGQPADARSDIWALGLVLYEMAAGSRPFRGQTGYELSSAILDHRPAPLAGKAPLGLRAVIERCLEKEPARRYQRAGEVRAALEATQTGRVSPWADRRYRLARRPWLALAAAVLVVAAVTTALNFERIRTRLWSSANHIESLAVLPLENLSGNPEQDYLAEGVHEALITDLAKLSGFRRVIARASVMRYRRSDKPLAQIGRELGVDAVITGAVQRSGDRVRVTAHLINAATEQQLWTEQYERQLRDVLSLQDEIVAAITRQINLKLTSQDQARLKRARPVDPEAYDTYLKGLSHLHRRTANDLEIAMQYFQRALEKDPNYAAAYAGIAQVWGHREVLGIVPRAAAEQGRSAAQKALELDDTSAEAHVVMSLMYSVFAAEWSAAEREFRRALELRPNDPDVHFYYGSFLVGQERFQEAEVEIRKALELDPLAAAGHSIYGNLFLDTHRYDEAISAYQKALQLNPSAPELHQRLLIAYHMKGMDQQAIVEAKVQFAQVEGDPESAAAVERGYAQGGFAEAMRRAAEASIARSRRAYVHPERIAMLFALAADKDRALEWLQKCFHEQVLRAEFLRQPLWDFVRSDPRFQELRRRRMNPPL